jgi:transposase-like protein
MGGESTEAWRAALDNLIGRGLRRPQFLLVDGAPGLDKAIAAVWDGVPVQRCTVHYAELRIMPTNAAKPAWEAVIGVKDAA